MESFVFRLVSKKKFQVFLEIRFEKYGGAQNGSQRRHGGAQIGNVFKTIINCSELLDPFPKFYSLSQHVNYKY